jgi:hypothetical protein
MEKRNLKLLVTAIVLSSSMTLGACGGGDNPPAALAEVVTVKKSISLGDNSAAKEVAKIDADAKFKILAMYCANIRPPPAPPSSQGVPLGLLEYVVLLAVASTDVEKAKAYGFSAFTAEEKTRESPTSCVSAPSVYL